MANEIKTGGGCPVKAGDMLRNKKSGKLYMAVYVTRNYTEEPFRLVGLEDGYAWNYDELCSRPVFEWFERLPIGTEFTVVVKS